MAVLSTNDISLPKTIASGLWSKAQSGSTVSALSGSEPMLFGDVDVMTFEARPRAEYVGEGTQKSPTQAGFGVRTITPKKVHVTMRFNEEVQWADEDHQLGVLTTLADAGGEALGRALDFGVYHAINPLTGDPIASISESVSDTTNTVASTDAPDIDLEGAVGSLLTAQFRPNGVALDPAYGWTLATARYSDGRKKFPDLGFGVNISTFEGLNASTSDTVSGQPEADDQGIRAIVGDFTTIRWGVQRTVPVELIRYGDPDGQGDLKRLNQIAMRLEIVYGWVLLDLDAFAVITSGAGRSRSGGGASTSKTASSKA